MFGFSIFEVLMIGVVALVAVGPQRLPGMLKTFGAWMRKIRKMTTDVRAQSGIDDLLRQEGIHGGLNELRSLVRGQAPPPPVPAYRQTQDPYMTVEVDLTREYPPEGPDAYGALPDDLLGPPPPKPAPAAPLEAKPEPETKLEPEAKLEPEPATAAAPEPDAPLPGAEAKLPS